jgi:hypothetical protein
LLKAKAEDAAGTAASSSSGESAAVTVLNEELERCKSMRDAAALVGVAFEASLLFPSLHPGRVDVFQQVLTLKSRVEELEEELRSKSSVDSAAVSDKIMLLTSQLEREQEEKAYAFGLHVPFFFVSLVIEEPTIPNVQYDVERQPNTCHAHF